jgi:hypothetical protein
MGPQEKRILGLIADDSTAVPLLNLPFTYTRNLSFDMKVGRYLIGAKPGISRQAGWRGMVAGPLTHGGDSL